MKQIAILTKEKANSFISKLLGVEWLCYYLNDDFGYFTDLKYRYDGKIQIKNLSGLFDATFQELKTALLDLVAKINSEHNSPEWWANSMIASRNTAFTPLFHNITYLFCAKKILSTNCENIIFIVDSRALSKCISQVASETGYKVIKEQRNVSPYYIETAKLYLYYAVQLSYFFLQVFRNRSAAKFLKPLSVKKTKAKKRIVIRSWVTKASFDKFGKFKDRNFGILPEWLRCKGYEVWILPTFADTCMKIKDIYALMKIQEQQFLLPEHYLKFSDYCAIVSSASKVLKTKIKSAEINEVNIAPIFNEVIEKIGFSPLVLNFNLCCPMLRRLKESGVEIDAFYYAFEGGINEKAFILWCRKYFTDSQIVAFQHTVFYQNQLAHYLSSIEEKIHPLPDRIICSGEIYIELYKRAGFSPELLVSGPNLRFDSVYTKPFNIPIRVSGEKNIFLPLNFSHNLTFELLKKVKDAVGEDKQYKFYIRTHPLLSKTILANFLHKIGMNDYEIADNGIIQEWLPKMHALISTGASVTVLEAVSMGVPVIRIIPDNTFFYDAFIWSDYPLNPISTPLEIQYQLRSINEILFNSADIFLKIGKEVLGSYFTKPSEEKLSLFL